MWSLCNTAQANEEARCLLSELTLKCAHFKYSGDLPVCIALHLMCHMAESCRAWGSILCKGNTLQQPKVGATLLMMKFWTCLECMARKRSSRALLSC